jgi:hypothetical protein
LMRLRRSSSAHIRPLQPVVPRARFAMTISSRGLLPCWPGGSASHGRSCVETFSGVRCIDPGVPAHHALNRSDASCVD